MLPLPGRGAFYSFRTKLYREDLYSDLHYRDGNFLVGVGKLNVGLIAPLGQLDVETFGSDSEIVKQLKKYKIPKKSKRIDEQKDLIKTGIKLGETVFGPSARVEKNQTYLLRSVAYDSIALKYVDKRLDVIIALKVVDLESDGVATIVWKRLSKRGAPLIGR